MKPTPLPNLLRDYPDPYTLSDAAHELALLIRHDEPIYRKKIQHYRGMARNITTASQDWEDLSRALHLSLYEFVKGYAYKAKAGVEDISAVAWDCLVEFIEYYNKGDLHHPETGKVLHKGEVSPSESTSKPPKSGTSELGKKALSREVLLTLENLEYPALDQARITAQLDRKLYQAVNEALEAAGGKWNRKAKAHAFNGQDAQALVGDIISTGFIVSEKDRDKALGYFPTPDRIADTVATAAMPTPFNGITILEPSAGTGNICKALLRRLEFFNVTPERPVTAVEIDPKREAHLRAYVSECAIRGGDFLKMEPDFHLGRFDVVAMNPPFSRQADLDHVLHAAGFLKQGGTLVSIMASGVTFRTNAKTQHFKDVLNRWFEHVEFADLEEGAFAEVGTQVSTVLLIAQGYKGA